MTALDTVQHISNPEWACWAPENHFGECCSVNRSTLGAVQVLDPAPDLPFRNPHCAAPFCIRNAVAACSRRRRQGRWPAPADGPPCRRCHQARSPWRRAGTSSGSAYHQQGSRSSSSCSGSTATHQPLRPAAIASSPAARSSDCACQPWIAARAGLALAALDAPGVSPTQCQACAQRHQSAHPALLRSHAGGQRRAPGLQHQVL